MDTGDRADRAGRAERAQLHQQLWRLAHDVSGYLRRHASPAVRLASALLLAASLAACNASASDTNVVETRTVAPLTQEVATGLPRGPGTYHVAPGSVFRDQRGVYQLEWLDSDQTSGPGHVAHVSRLRLVREDRLLLELPPDAGADPVLHLPDGEEVGLIEEAPVGRTQAGPAYYPPVFSWWSPFGPGMLLYSRPAYYDPPRTVVVERAPSGGAGDTTTTRSAMRVSGGSVSETAPPPAQRITGLQTAVGGRAGGTGAGSAVTNRNLNRGASRPSSGSGSSAGVTSGSSGSTRSSGSSVTAPRSGGFSSGIGSLGGSSAS